MVHAVSKILNISGSKPCTDLNWAPLQSIPSAEAIKQQEGKHFLLTELLSVGHECLREVLVHIHSSMKQWSDEFI